MTARSINARRINARRISIVGQAVVVSVLGDQGCAGDALEVVLPTAPGEYSRTKISRKLGPQRAKIEEKSTQEPSKIDVGSVLGGFKRSTSL